MDAYQLLQQVQQLASQTSPDYSRIAALIKGNSGVFTIQPRVLGSIDDMVELALSMKGSRSETAIRLLKSEYDTMVTTFDGHKGIFEMGAQNITREGTLPQDNPYKTGIESEARRLAQDQIGRGNQASVEKILTTLYMVTKLNLSGMGDLASRIGIDVEGALRYK